MEGSAEAMNGTSRRNDSRQAKGTHDSGKQKDDSYSSQARGADDMALVVSGGKCSLLPTCCHGPSYIGASGRFK